MANNRIGLNELEAALAVARHGSFRQAAIELNLSTSTLSNTIAKLESALRTRLFNRTTRSVSLTEAGALYLQQVGPALQNMHEAIGEVRAHSAQPAGTLRINAFASAARAANGRPSFKTALQPATGVKLALAHVSIGNALPRMFGRLASRGTK